MHPVSTLCDWKTLASFAAYPGLPSHRDATGCAGRGEAAVIAARLHPSECCHLQQSPVASHEVGATSVPLASIPAS